MASPTALPLVDARGTHWRDKFGKYHRDNDKPAFIGVNGTREWADHGCNHRADDKPAVIWPDGSYSWYTNGVKHRGKNKPALLHTTGCHVWWEYGTFCRSVQVTDFGQASMRFMLVAAMLSK